MRPLWLLIVASFLCTVFISTVGIIAMYQSIKERAIKLERIIINSNGIAWCLINAIGIDSCVVFFLTKLMPTHRNTDMHIFFGLCLLFLACSSGYFIRYKSKLLYLFETLCFFNELTYESDLFNNPITNTPILETEKIVLTGKIFAVQDENSLIKLTKQIGNNQKRKIITKKTIASRFYSAKSKNVTFTTSQELPSPKDLNSSGLPLESDRPVSVITKNEDAVDCLICFENKSNAFLLKCGHSGICFECATKILKTTHSCHLCRKVDIYIGNLIGYRIRRIAI